MAKNSKPILSVLIEEDKRTKFADLARRHSLSMGWLVNQAIDRMINADSIDIYRDSIERIPAGTPMGAPIEQQLPPSIDIADIEKLISDSIENRGLIDEETAISMGLSAADVDQLVETSIARRGLITEELATDIIDRKLESIDELVKAQIEPLADLLGELEAYTQTQFKAVREEIKKPLAIAKPVQVEMNLPATKPDPAWVNTETRPFYRKLVADRDLLPKVVEAIDRHPDNNSEIAHSLIALGFHKQDGLLSTSPNQSFRELV
jgi:hypothetical protein